MLHAQGQHSLVPSGADRFVGFVERNRAARAGRLDLERRHPGQSDARKYAVGDSGRSEHRSDERRVDIAGSETGIVQRLGDSRPGQLLDPLLGEATEV